MTPTSRTVLVVDDDESIRTMVVGYLEAHGMRAAAASGADEALAILARGGVDLVITDYALPQKDGLALIAAIAAEPALGHVRCVLMSGRADALEALHDLDRAGSVVFVRKPFALTAMGILVRRLRGRRSDTNLPAIG